MPSVNVDVYVLDRLMPDLVGHERQLSAFVMYLLSLAANPRIGPTDRAGKSDGHRRRHRLVQTRRAGRAPGGWRSGGCGHAAPGMPVFYSISVLNLKIVKWAPGRHEPA